MKLYELELKNKYDNACIWVLVRETEEEWKIFSSANEVDYDECLKCFGCPYTDNNIWFYADSYGNRDWVKDVMDVYNDDTAEDDFEIVNTSILWQLI